MPRTGAGGHLRVDSAAACAGQLARRALLRPSKVAAGRCDDSIAHHRDINSGGSLHLIDRAVDLIDRAVDKMRIAAHPEGMDLLGEVRHDGHSQEAHLHRPDRPVRRHAGWRLIGASSGSAAGRSAAGGAAGCRLQPAAC